MFKEETYRAFFHESSVRNLGIAHWGYGKLGKEFQEYAQKYNFQGRQITNFLSDSYS